MSKSKSNRKWYDDEYDMDDYNARRKNQDRRKQKKMKNALRSKNYDVDVYATQDE